MKKTKAAFRALREDCGLTQNDVAVEMDVDVRSVKRWENGSIEGYEPPDGVWAWLQDAYVDMQAEATRLAAEIMTAVRDSGSTEPVAIRYYRTQEQLDAVQLPAGRDLPVGYANAISREVARTVAEAGIDVDYFYPEQMEIVEEA